MISKMRVIYDKTGKIIWTHSLDGVGDFPQSIEDEIKEYAEGTQCIELTEESDIDAFVKSDENTIVDGKIVIGKTRPVIAPIPQRDLAKELDELKVKVATLEIQSIKVITK